ncbi:MAG: hypothetical protein ACHP85_02930 [Burkholderiales bacterium]|jgi:hypothetical protein
MSVALSIAFTGLCALVTDGDRSPAQVLLVDAKGIGTVNGVLLPEHAPTLVVSLSSLANAGSSNPTRVIVGAPRRDANAGALGDQIGLWDLTGAEVRVHIQGRGSESLELSKTPERSTWPEPPHNVNDPGAWRDLRYIADMKSLAGDGRIHPALIGPGSGLPSAVSARIQLDGGRLEAGIPSLEIYRDDVFEFKGKQSTGLRQALTDTIRWSLESDAAAVIVEITTAGGQAKRLVFAPSTQPHSLFISNLPTENPDAKAHHAMSVDEMAALHFGAYYKLLMNEPADGPLPRISAVATRRGAGFMHTGFCPPARFTRN